MCHNVTISWLYYIFCLYLFIWLFILYCIIYKFNTEHCGSPLWLPYVSLCVYKWLVIGGIAGSSCVGRFVLSWWWPRPSSVPDKLTTDGISLEHPKGHQRGKYTQGHRPTENDNTVSNLCIMVLNCCIFNDRPGHLTLTQKMCMRGRTCQKLSITTFSLENIKGPKLLAWDGPQ